MKYTLDRDFREIYGHEPFRPVEPTPEFVKSYGEDELFVAECIHCGKRYWLQEKIGEENIMPCEFCDASCKVIAKVEAPEIRQQKLTEVMQ